LVLPTPVWQTEDTHKDIKLGFQGGPLLWQGQAVIPVGGPQEEGPLVHLLGHVHIVLAPDGHSVGLPQQVINVVVDVVRVLTQLGKVMDLFPDGQL